jgi:hypothetical protein
MRFATIADKERIEEICNDPLVRLWQTFDGLQPYKADQYLRDPSRVIIGEGGVFSLLRIDPGRYVVHADLLPEHRGQAAINAGKMVLEMMFCETDCVEMLAVIPCAIPQSKMYARCQGFKYAFRRESMWPAGRGLHDVEFYRLTLEDWMTSIPGPVQESVAFRAHQIAAFDRKKANEAYNTQYTIHTIK